MQTLWDIQGRIGGYPPTTYVRIAPGLVALDRSCVCNDFLTLHLPLILSSYLLFRFLYSRFFFIFYTLTLFTFFGLDFVLLNNCY